MIDYNNKGVNFVKRHDADWKRTWDGVPIPYVNVRDLDAAALHEFRRKALASVHLTKEDLDIANERLLSTLNLFNGRYLKRAAILCFHQDPGNWVTGAYVKIGYYMTDDDLVFQDEVHGPLITMPDRVMGMLFGKYFKEVAYNNDLQRINASINMPADTLVDTLAGTPVNTPAGAPVETYPVSKDAMYEAIINAIVHKDYSSGNPIQIRVYDDKVTIFNNGNLPMDWTEENLLASHTFNPINPNIASTFLHSGMAEAWGRGIDKIISSSVEMGNPRPKFEIAGYGLCVSFHNNIINETNALSEVGEMSEVGETDIITETDVTDYTDGVIDMNEVNETDVVTETDVTDYTDEVIDMNEVGETDDVTEMDVVTETDDVTETDVVTETEEAETDVVTVAEETSVEIKLSDRQRSILDAMLENPKITAGVIAEKIGISQRRVESNISKLRDAGCVKREGSRKDGHWVVTSNSSTSSSTSLPPI